VHVTVRFENKDLWSMLKLENPKLWRYDVFPEKMLHRWSLFYFTPHVRGSLADWREM
jgi:hypothetical protein